MEVVSDETDVCCAVATKLKQSKAGVKNEFMKLSVEMRLEMLNCRATNQNGPFGLEYCFYRRKPVRNWTGLRPIANERIVIIVEVYCIMN